MGALPTRQTRSLSFALGSDTIEKDMLDFVRRDIIFLHDTLEMTFTQIGESCRVSASTVANIYHGRTKHPQFRTMCWILDELDLEFDGGTIRNKRGVTLRAV